MTAASAVTRVPGVYAFSAGSAFAPEALLRPGLHLGIGRTTMTCLLVERRGGLVLVDTGFGLESRARPWRCPGLLFQLTAKVHVGIGEAACERVRALGYRPDDVTDIICTHLDSDHCAALSDFPRARVHVSRPELEDAVGTYSTRYNASCWSHGARFEGHDLLRTEALGFPTSRDLFGDGSILLLGAPGHTRGHVAVAVRTARGHVVHLGDSVYLEGEIRRGAEALGPGFRLLKRLTDEDPRTSRITRELIRELLRRPEIVALTSHDEVSLERVAHFPWAIAALA